MKPFLGGLQILHTIRDNLLITFPKINVQRFVTAPPHISSNSTPAETRFKHNDMVLVSVTFPTMSEARRFSKKLVRQRLAACVNIHPIESIYWWKGKLVHTQEAIAEAKTVNGKVSAIKRFVQKNHSDQ